MAIEHQKGKTYKISVSGVEHIVDHDVLTYEEIVLLFVNPPVEGTIYAETYEKAKFPKEGELLTGQSVTIKNNTEFDVDDTGRS